jgi:hypothetical protein
MSLSNDIARCNGKPWAKFALEPACTDCQRYTDPGTGEHVAHIPAPAESPCSKRIAPEAE